MNTWPYNQTQFNHLEINASMPEPYQAVEDEEEEEDDIEAYSITNQTQFKNMNIVKFAARSSAISFSQIINYLKTGNQENIHEINNLTRFAYNCNIQQFMENLNSDNISQVDESGSIPIFYTIPKNNTISVIIFLYLFIKTFDNQIIFNGEGKTLLHYVIQYDNEYLFRILSKYQPTNDLLEYIIANDSVKCYRHFKSLHFKDYAFQLKIPLKEKLTKFNHQTRLQKILNNIMDFHSPDASSNLTVLYLIIFIFILFMFSFSKVYQLDNILVFDFGLIMVAFYWLFCQIWFINQSYYVGAKKKSIDHYIPQDAKMLQIFKDYYDRDPSKGEVPVFNWYDEGKKINIIEQKEIDIIKVQWKYCEGLSKLLGESIHQDQIDLFSLIFYLIENKNFEKISQLDLDRWCPTCLIFKAQGTKHCYICNQCIKQQSHHSFFYNRCIDEGNQFFYLILLSTQWTLLCLYLGRVCYFLISRTESYNIFTIILKLIELDGYGGFFYHILLFYIFWSNTCDLLLDIRGMTYCLTRNEMKNYSRYKYIDWKNRRPQGILTNLINFSVSRISNAKMM